MTFNLINGYYCFCLTVSNCEVPCSAKLPHSVAERGLGGEVQLTLWGGAGARIISKNSSTPSSPSYNLVSKSHRIPGREMFDGPNTIWALFMLDAMTNWCERDQSALCSTRLRTSMLTVAHTVLTTIRIQTRALPWRRMTEARIAAAQAYALATSGQVGFIIGNLLWEFSYQEGIIRLRWMEAHRRHQPMHNHDTRIH